MVTQDQGSTQAPAPEAPAPEATETQSDNPIIDELDRLNTADVETTPTEAPATTETQAPVAEAPPAKEPESQTPTPETPPVPETPVQQGPGAEEVQRLQQQAAEYEQLRMRAAMQREANKYQQQLETQGYLPEQAQQAAQQYAQSKQAQSDLAKRADEYGRWLQAKQTAAEHFAQKYSLSMGDLAVLRQADDEVTMENIAKEVSKRRSMEEELNRLKQAQVPPQKFDNSQGAPDVAPNDSGWLDRYNNGDRSENAQAAARKAAGL